MEVFLELVFGVSGEFILEFGAGLLSDSGLRLLRQKGSRGSADPQRAVAGGVMLGALSGAVSLWLFPGFFLTSHAGRVVSLVATPVVVGAAMALVGAWRRRRGESLLHLDRFGHGYVFALSMAAVRFVFADAA